MAHELHLANNYRFHCVEGQKKKKKPWRWVIQMEQNEKKKKTVIEQTACKYEQTANDHQVSNKRHFNSAKRIMNIQNLNIIAKLK